jgi:hypothetical protein
MINREVYLDRAQSQEELNGLITLCLNNSKGITYEDFKRLTEEVCSDMFLSVN